MLDQPDGQLPNSEGVVEDPAQIPPPPPVHPESVEIPNAEASVEASYNEEEVTS
jgi:hypothetical protein